MHPIEGIIVASLVERNGRFQVAFRFGGRQYRHGLGKASRAEAESCRARVEENLRLLNRGRLELPPGANVGFFLVSDGKLTGRPGPPPRFELAQLRDRYLEGHAGILESNTLATARVHFRHLAATFGESFDLARLDLSALERHVRRRSAMPGRRGGALNPETIRKEVKAFGTAWHWAARRGFVLGPFPSDGLAYPKTSERPPFRTRAEIEAEIRRGTTGDEAAELWRSVFLTLPEVDEVLGLIRDRPGPAWLFPAAMLAAHTGARRSEIIRAQVGDFDLAGGTALIREKKRARGRLTTRRVPISPALGRILARWFGPDHPGGPWAIASAAPPPRSRVEQDGPAPVTVGASNHYLRAVLAGTRWAMIGWHTFRHSFASNCAARGVDERVIDAWMGHQTEAMRRRYRHLLPDQTSAAIRLVFPDDVLGPLPPDDVAREKNSLPRADMATTQRAINPNFKGG